MQITEAQYTRAHFIEHSPKNPLRSACRYTDSLTERLHSQVRR